MHLDQKAEIGKFELRVYSDSDTGDSKLEVLENGALKYSERARQEFDGGFKIECTKPTSECNALVLSGRDFTGSGAPEVLVSNYSGGAHCCTTYEVLELGERVRKIGAIDAGDGSISPFIPERNGNVDFILNDWTFAYWNASFAESPAPQVILRYGQHGYEIAAALMRKPAPSPAEFARLVAEGKRQFISSLIPPAVPDNVNRATWAAEGEKSSYSDWQQLPDSKFWSIMLDLVYSGHMGLAWRFCDEAWMADPAAEERFLVNFRHQLRKSPYWPGIQRLNQTTP